MTIEPHRGLLVEGATPGGAVVWVGAARVGFSGGTTVREGADLQPDDDGDGTVEIPVEGGVPTLSAWAVVDLASGKAATASPEGFGDRLFPVPPNLLQQGLHGRLSRFVSDGRVVDVLLVRPGVGAWRVCAGDGGEGDSDGRQDGTLRVDLESFAALGGAAPPPEEVLGGDVVVLLDSERMIVAAGQVAGRSGGSAPAGGQ